MKLVIWLLSLLCSPRSETLYASVFASAGDIHMGGPSPCLRDSFGNNRRVRPTDSVIAHRTLPCGTRVLVTNPRTGLSAMARVGERGPYGACVEPGWSPGDHCPRRMTTIKRRRTDPGAWRGSFDLTPAVQTAIKHNGFEKITVTSARRRPTRQ